MGYMAGYALGYMRPHWGRGSGSGYIPLDPAIVIAIVVGSLVLPLVLVLLINGRMRRRARKEQELAATGTPGQARVLALQPGRSVLRMGVQRLLSVVLSLEVHVPGRAPYTIQVQKYVPELNLALFQQGNWLDVRVNPNNPNELAVVGAGSPPNHAGAGAAPMAGASGSE